MKIKKQNPKDLILQKYPTVYLEKQGEEYILYLPNKSGKCVIGRSKDEGGSWQAGAAFLSIK